LLPGLQASASPPLVNPLAGSSAVSGCPEYFLICTQIKVQVCHAFAGFIAPSVAIDPVDSP
jgi:hypothetical protein